MNDNDELKSCHAEIRRLQAENHDLRRASESFGSLAERLSQKLRNVESGGPTMANAAERDGVVSGAVLDGWRTGD